MDRIQGQKVDPWQGFWEARQRLPVR